MAVRLRCSVATLLGDCLWDLVKMKKVSLPGIPAANPAIPMTALCSTPTSRRRHDAQSSSRRKPLPAGGRISDFYTSTCGEHAKCLSIMCVYRLTARTNECQSLGIDNSIRLQREPSNHATRTVAHIVCVSEAETRFSKLTHRGVAEWLRLY